MTEDLVVYEENVMEVLEEIEVCLEESRNKTGRGKLNVKINK